MPTRQVLQRTGAAMQSCTQWRWTAEALWPVLSQGYKTEDHQGARQHRPGKRSLAGWSESKIRPSGLPIATLAQVWSACGGQASAEGVLWEKKKLNVPNQPHPENSPQTPDWADCLGIVTPSGSKNWLHWKNTAKNKNLTFDYKGLTYLTCDDFYSRFRSSVSVMVRVQRKN